MKIYFAFIFLFLANLLQAQKSFDFGKRQQYVCSNNEKETSFNKNIIEAYASIYPDSLEIPLNRCLSNDSMTVFIGVSFKYSFDTLCKALVAAGQNLWSELDKANLCFYLQNDYNQSIISRYIYYSKVDELLYVINFKTVSNHPFSTQLFKDLTTSIRKK